jgi:uncharacterized protein (DUF58 family)
VKRAAGTAALGAALGLSGLLFALPSLLIPGLALLLLSLAASAWVRLGARRSRLRVGVHPAHVEEGQPVTVTASTHLRRWSPPAELVVPSLGRSEMAGSGRLELALEARFERRGRRTLGPARVSFQDPLGLATVRGRESFAEVLVLPRVEPVRPGRRSGLEGLDGSAGRSAGPELEFDTLQRHRTGSPASRIHWPTVARGGELMERRLSPEADSRPLVILDATVPASDESLDRAVRAAASLCRALASAAGCRLVLPGDRRATAVEPDLRAWPAAHARLALVDAGDAPPALPRTVGASAVFWVLASRRPAPRALQRAVTAHRYLVTPGRPPAGGAAFTVAGCAGVRLERVRARAA